MEQATAQLRALLIESDPATRDLLRVGLESFDEVVVDVAEDRWGVELVRDRPYDLVLIDLDLGDDSDGFAHVGTIREYDERPLIIAVKPGRTSRHLSREKNAHDIFALITLPLDVPAFFKTIARARDRILESRRDDE